MNKSYITLLDNALSTIITNYTQSTTLQEAMRYSLLNGGKRFRPLIILSMLADRQTDIKHGLDIACAIEMIHAYSLIHDDLPAMDNDDYRRGQLTNHKVYGEAVAILAGDALLTEAFSVMVNSNLPSEVKVKIISDVSSLIGANGMVAGQCLDILAPEHISRQEIETIHFHKTHDLILAAFLAGAHILKLDDNTIVKLREGARHIGLAFQVKDDIADATADINNDGENVNSDLKNNRSTYPKVYGIEKSKLILDEHRQSGLAIIEEIFDRKELYSLIEEVI